MTLETPCVGGATNTVRSDVKREHLPGFVAVPAFTAWWGRMGRWTEATRHARRAGAR